MSKRRLDQDDPQVSLSKSLEMAIFNSSDTDISVLLQNIKENIFNFDKTISNALLQCAMDLPHKTGFYIKIMRELAIDNRFLISMIMESMSLLPLSDWRRLSQLFRLIVMMTNYGLFTIDDLNSHFEELFKVWNKDHFYEKWCISTCIGLLPQSIASKLLDKLQQDDAMIDDNDNDNDDILSFNHLRDILKSESLANWQDPLIVEETIEVPFKIPHFDWSRIKKREEYEHSLDWNLSLFSKKGEESTDNNNNNKLSWKEWNTIYTLKVIVENFRHNHQACSDIISKMEISEKELAEFLFKELLTIHPVIRGKKEEETRDQLSSIYFEVLLMDLCVKIKTFPPVFAKIIHGMITTSSVDDKDSDNDYHSLGFVEICKLADFLAFQMSNFDFKWAWESLGKAVESSENAKEFLKVLLRKLLNLSYREKIESIIPDWAKPFLPAPVRVVEESNPIVSALLVRSNPQDVLNRVKDSGISSKLFIKCLLTVGHHTLSHVQVLLEKYLLVLIHLNPKHDREARMETLNGIRDFFLSSNYIQYEHTLLRLLQYRIVLPEDVLYHLIEHADDILLSYDCLFLTLRQVVKLSSFVASQSNANVNNGNNINSDVITKIETEADDSIKLATSLLEERRRQANYPKESKILLDMENAIKKMYPIK